MKGKFYIGTSGWVYQQWKGIFYPPDLPSSKWLDFYIQKFDTVEINASFYRVPKESTFENWRKKTPKDFVFSVKLSNYISRNLKLKNAEESTDYFLSQANGLKDKLKVILVQLPPNFKVNLERLQVYLDFLKAKEVLIPFAFEFRHRSWLIKETFDLLKAYNQTLVIAESDSWPSVEKVTSNLIYLRFHGPKSLYSSNYPSETLKIWAEKIKNWLSRGKQVFVYFNNDQAGYALKNARELRDFVKF